MERIGFLGLGIMGSRMAANLRRAGCELTVFNRTRSRADAFAAEHGATVAEDPAALAGASDILLSMVVDGPQVLGLARELVAGDGDGKLLVDLSPQASSVRAAGASWTPRSPARRPRPRTGR
jgi:3-hydroxyisobutyrate dehydrogenase-like beta-hydroxyacid dehydrogenase